MSLHRTLVQHGYVVSTAGIPWTETHIGQTSDKRRVNVVQISDKYRTDIGQYLTTIEQSGALKKINASLKINGGRNHTFEHVPL